MEKYDVIIVGGGPGGLACGQYSSRAGRKTVIIEEMAPGGQLMIIDKIENYPGLGEIEGFELAQRFEEQAVKFGCEVLYATVNSVKKQGNTFHVDTTNGELSAPTVVISTGSKHRYLEIPGEKELAGHGVSYCATCDGPFFKGKKMVVCGGGDSACQEAMYLAKLSDNVTIVHRRDRFRAQASIAKALDNNKAITKKMSHQILSINSDGAKVNSVTLKDLITGQVYEEKTDAVFVFVGSIPQTSSVLDCKKDEAGYIVTDERMMTSVEGMFAVGDVRSTPFRQIVTAASDGAIAAHYANEFIDTLQGCSY